MDYIKFCRNYFAMTNIPVSLLRGEVPLYSSLGEMLSLEIYKPGAVFWEEGGVYTNPTLCRYSPEIEYGCVHVEGTDYYIVLGPVFSVPVTDEIVNLFMRENHIPMIHREAVSDFLHAIPLTSPQKYYRHLLSLHMSLNQVDMELDDLYQQVPEDSLARSSQLVKEMLSDMESEQLVHGYDQEQQLYRVISGGDVLVLDDFLNRYLLDQPEGVLASSPLRHEKNLLIQTVTKVGMQAGIPAGMDIGQVYTLTELYIQECEKLQSIEEVKSLSYAMMKDFCQRCAEAKLPAGISRDIYRCLQYIHIHLAEPITIQDLTAYTGRSRSYLTRRFKEEMGMSINYCIMQYKLNRAKELLTYSEGTLAEISYLLGYSSQSYFQNTFKKEFGVTPMQYRRQTRRGDKS